MEQELIPFLGDAHDLTVFSFGYILQGMDTVFVIHLRLLKITLFSAPVCTLRMHLHAIH